MTTPVDNGTRAAYLANVLSIAKIDDGVAPDESRVLRSIIHRIGATQQDLVAAGKLLSSGRFNMDVPDSPSLRMDNLQDMVMVALADGSVSSRESAPIEVVAEAMNYSQADIDLAVRRAKLALQKLQNEPSPLPLEVKAKPTTQTPPRTHTSDSNRKHSREQHARPQERRQSWRQDATDTKPESPPEIIQSQSVHAKEQPPTRPKAQTPESITEPPPTILVQETAPPPPPKEETEKRPNTSTRAQNCAADRAKSDTPDTYCFGATEGPLNPWGCRLSKMAWVRDAAWMRLGHFRDDVTFIFDKRAIAQQLASNLADVLDCPYLNTNFTEAAFDCLPTRVSVGERWHYQYAETSDADSTTVKETHYVHGCAVTSTATVEGVDPVGSRDALKIVRKATKAVKYQDGGIDKIVNFINAFDRPRNVTSPYGTPRPF